MPETSDIWKKFCADLEKAGQQVLSADLATTEREKAEGVRYLTRLLRIGLDMHLEHADPALPSFIFIKTQPYLARRVTALRARGALYLS